MNNKLVFDVMDLHETTLMHVKCIEGEGLTVCINDMFERFSDKYSHVANNLFDLLNGLHDIFIDCKVASNKDLIYTTLDYIEHEPFNLHVKYVEDTIFNRAKKDSKSELEELNDFFNSLNFNINDGRDFDLGSLAPVNFDMLPDISNSMWGKKRESGMMYEGAKLKEEKNKRTSITFEDVVGMEEVKDKLQDVIQQFKQAEKFKAWNIKPIKGILFYGPSGTGKSYIAEAFANEIDAEFFPLSTADIMSKYLGESGKAIRAKFEEARKKELSIIYIDEIDAIAAKRDGSENSKERNATLNELLVQMASPLNDNIIMIFATNMLDLLDPAFLRSGRCDFKLEVSLPDYECRKGILELNSKGRPLGEDVDFGKLARNMSGMNCADMAQVANEGARIALKQDKDQIDMCDFEQAFEEMVCGLQTKTKHLSELEKDYVAIHETGHLFANEVYEVNKTKKISILPRGTTLGFVMHVNEEDNDKWLHSKDELLNQIKVCLAGRAAEDVFYGDVTTGASNDLEKANKIANNMVTQYAFVEELGLSTFDMRNPFSLTIVQKYVDAILRDCYAEVKQMIIENKDNIREFANVLKEKEEMVLEEIMEALNLETAE